MASKNLQPTINKPTRIIKNQKPSLIDNFFTNSLYKEIITGNLVSKITDHMPNFFIMKNTCFEHKNIKIKRRSFKDFNLADYQNDISSIDLLTALVAYSDLNEIYKYYHDQLLAVINKHAPFVLLSKRETRWMNKPWIGKRIQLLIKEKEFLYSKYLKKRSNFWYRRYRTACDIVKGRIAEDLTFLGTLKLIFITRRRSGKV